MKPYENIRGKKTQIREMFDNIAPTYDRLNHLLSLNIDRLWRRDTVRAVARRRPSSILDVATGTGDLAAALARRMPAAQITGIDLSEEMLAVARAKIARAGLTERVELLAGDAERLPFGEECFDAVTVAFGVRNFEDVDAGLREMHRVLRRGGVLAVLELSTPDNRAFGALYRAWSRIVLPGVGGMVSHDGKAYEYLPASVEEFPSAERFAAQLREAGFRSVEIENKTFGTARLYIAEK